MGNRGLVLRQTGLSLLVSCALLSGLSCGGGTEPSDPPGTQIVFQSSDSSISDIYVVNADGSGLTRLTDYAEADVAPSWSGDGRQIYFLSSNRDGSQTWDLYAMNADGTDAHLVVNRLYEPYAVSPDGTHIALGVYQYPNVDLFVMNADGSERARIVDLPCEYLDVQCENIEALAWSPDGQRIAYSTRWQGHGSNTDGYIGVVNADGTGQRRLTASGTRSAEPAWAPDGHRIVFSSRAQNPTYISTPMDLEIINPDGTGRMVLLDGDVDGMANTSPSWSPDGQSIVFARFSPGPDWVVPGQSELFAVNVDGTGLRRVTSVPGGAFAPDWNPAGP